MRQDQFQFFGDFGQNSQRLGFVAGIRATRAFLVSASASFAS